MEETNVITEQNKGKTFTIRRMHLRVIEGPMLEQNTRSTMMSSRLEAKVTATCV